MPVPINGDEFARRLRAAAAYADLNHAELADRIGYERQQVGRWMRATAIPKRPVRDAIADACGVPRSFFDTGFQHDESPVTPGSRG